MKSQSRFIASTLIFALASLWLSADAHAVTVYYTADTALLHLVLDEMEIEYELALDGDNDPVWAFTHSGILITIAAYDETAPGRYGSLLFYAGWAIDTQVPLSEINDWNSRSRFGRAYVDEAGDPAIELDLLLTGGVTSQTLSKYIDIFVGTASDLGAALQL